MLAEYKLTLPPQSLDTAEPKGRAVLEEVVAKVGFVPNMYAVMVNSPGLLKTYLEGYAQFRQESGFTPAEQEVIFLTISRENGCEYCVAAHSLIADAVSKVPPAVTNAIREGRGIPDAQLAALSEFTRVMLSTRGLPARKDVEKFLAAGYTQRQVLEIVLALAVKTLSNYANHLFHTPLDKRLAPRRWQG